MTLPEPLRTYDQACHHAAEQIIIDYSTSFRLATALLGTRVRRDIRTLYAMVRIADEIVDGAAGAASVADIGARLDDYETCVLAAPATRFHTDPVLHAYADTARRCQFTPGHIRAFFASMRADLHTSTHDEASLDSYVYGSAEVIGLLCLAVFYADEPRPADYLELERGAQQLGAAFQKINFLRDLAEDTDELGREYFAGPVDEARKDSIIASIRADLAGARPIIDRLPRSARLGVRAATGLFEELTDRLAATPAKRLYRRRVTVPAHVKARILARALSGGDASRSRHE